jgi:hypothetical protein
MMTDQAYYDRVTEARKRVQPVTYVCYRAAESIIVDGRLEAPSWKRAEWTNLFGHIEEPHINPEWATRAKMLWDDHFFYVAVDMECPDVWATITTRDEHVYAYDPDFEVFIDPDGDGEHYMEFGMNAINGVYDFLLHKPYDRGGGETREIDWNWEGLRSAVQVQGTLNAPWIEDRGWTAVIAFDYESMEANAPTAHFPPQDGDVWRVNLSRLVRDRANTWTGKDWTWSCVGVYSMHIPELYGYVQFSDQVVGTARVPFEAETW